MKRPINVQPEVTAYYLEIQMQGEEVGGKARVGVGREGCAQWEEEEDEGEEGEVLILSHKTGHIREQ